MTLKTSSNNQWNNYDSILCLPDIIKCYSFLREKRMNYFHDWAKKNGLKNVSYDFDKLVFLQQIELYLSRAAYSFSNKQLSNF